MLSCLFVSGGAVLNHNFMACLEVFKDLPDLF